MHKASPCKEFLLLSSTNSPRNKGFLVKLIMRDQERLPRTGTLTGVLFGKEIWAHKTGESPFKEVWPKDSLASTETEYLSTLNKGALTPTCPGPQPLLYRYEGF